MIVSSITFRIYAKNYPHIFLLSEVAIHYLVEVANLVYEATFKFELICFIINVADHDSAFSIKLNLFIGLVFLIKDSLPNLIASELDLLPILKFLLDSIELKLSLT